MFDVHVQLGLLHHIENDCANVHQHLKDLHLYISHTFREGISYISRHLSAYLHLFCGVGFPLIYECVNGFILCVEYVTIKQEVVEETDDSIPSADELREEIQLITPEGM